MSLDPSSLNFVEVQGTLSSLILGSPLLNGGPLQIVKPPGSLTKMSSFAELKFCVLRECPNMQVVIIGEKRNASFFPKLEYLGLHYLWNLERIWEDDPTPGSYGALKYLEISTCGKLEYVASHCVFQCLSNLETFIVEDCESLKSIVKEDAMVKGAAAAAAALLPRLKKLLLRHLPELVALGRGLFPSEEVIEIQCCPKFIMSEGPSRIKELKKKLLSLPNVEFTISALLPRLEFRRTARDDQNFYSRVEDIV